MSADELRLSIAEAKGLDVSEHAEHDWKREPGGDIDLYAYSNDPHSGPYCDRCGYSFCTGCSGDDGYNNGLPCKSYPPYWTEHMNAAWELVEEMIANDRKFHLLRFGYLPSGSPKKREQKITWEVCYGEQDVNLLEYARGETAPLAIARAWLMWKEGV